MPEERADKGKVVSSITILGCKTDFIETPDGKRHIESDCLNKHARDYFSSFFEEEAIMRINPKVSLEPAPEPAPEPVPEPAPEPVPEPNES